MDLYASTNNWVSNVWVGSISGTGITASDTNTFHTGTQSWFGTSLTVNPGATAQFRLFVRGSSSSSSYIGFNPDLDWTLEGTLTGGAWNLIWNGSSNMVYPGATGLFTGTDSAGQTVSNPAFQPGDNVTLNLAGTMNVSNNTTFGTLTLSNTSGTNSFAGGNILAANLVKSGAGTLVLSNTNSFSAGTISAGTTLAESSTALGSSAVTFSGATLKVTNASVTNLASPFVVGIGGMILDHSSALNLSGTITGSNNTLTKTGAGELTLSGAVGANKAGVTLMMSNGSMALTGGAKELGGSNTWNGPVLASNVMLNLSQNLTIGGTNLLRVSNGTIATVFGSSGGSCTITKDTEFSGNTILDAAYGKTLRFETGLVSGDGNLTASGSGAIQFISTGTSTWGGSITYGGSGGLTLTPQIADNLRAIVLTNATNTPLLTLTNSSANTGASVNAPISGNGSVRKTGSGEVILVASNGFAGGLVLDGSGPVSVQRASSLGTGPITSSNSSGTVALVAGGDSAITISNPLVVPLVVSTNTNNVVSTNIYAAVFSPGTNRAITLAGVISGGGSLKLTGGGDLAVANSSNSYSGGTEIGTGRILVGSGTALGTGPVNFGTSSGSHLVATNSFVLPRNLTIGSGYTANVDSGAFVLELSGSVANKAGSALGGTLQKLGGGTLVLTGSNTYSGGTVIAAGNLQAPASSLPGPVTNLAILTIDQSTNGSLAHAITGTGQIIKNGVGSLLLSGNNSHSGGTILRQGVTTAGNVNAFGAGPITVESGATLDLNLLDITNVVVNNGGLIINSTGSSGLTFNGGTNEVSANNSTIDMISGSATVNVTGVNVAVSLMSGGTLNVGASGLTVFNFLGGNLSLGAGYSVLLGSGSSSGVISGSGGVTKVGTNNLTLAGANTYTGPTAVSSGKLTIDGSIASSSVTVTNTGIFSGSGTVGSTAVGNGGTIAPGNGVGTLNVAGSWKLNGSGNYNWQIYNAAGSAGSGYDVLAVSGAIDLTGLSNSNKFNINLASLSALGSSEPAGQAINFNKAQGYSWVIATAANGFVGNFDPSLFTVNAGAANGTAGFQNDLGGGSFGVIQDGNSLILIFNPASVEQGGVGPIRITATPSGSTAVGVKGWYVQSFNGILPATGTVGWTNNETVPGWYAATGDNPANHTNIVVAAPSPANNTSGQLLSVPQHFDANTADSTYRALAVCPSGGTGPSHLAVRFLNNTTNTITGFTVSYEMRWGYSQLDSVDSFDLIAGGSGYGSAPTLVVTGSTNGTNAGGTVTLSSSSVGSVSKTNSGSGYTSAPVVSFTNGGGSGAMARAIMNLVTSSNSVTLSHKIFSPGSGTLANYSSAGWTTVTTTTNKNFTSSSVPDNYNYVTAAVTNVSVAPGQELWLCWQVNKLGSTASSIAAIDNVRVGNFGVANPAIMTQPLAQSVILGNNAVLSVGASASGGGSIAYQWRKNGANISGATGPNFTLTNAQPTDIGSYDVVVTSGGASVTSKAVPVQVYSRMAVRGAGSSNLTAAPALAAYTVDAGLRDITVTTTTGYANKFDLYVPQGTIPPSGWPAVLVIHGGGGNDGDKADSREMQACQEFASHGYVAMSINYKRSFQTKSTGNWTLAWPQNIKDAKTAVRWLRANAATYGIDPNRIGAIGFSWGGNEAAMLALTDGDAVLDPASEDGLGVYSTKVACAANFYGAVQIPDYHNMNQFSGNGIPGSAGTMDYAGGTNNYLAASPASRATSSAAPMLLSHGDADLEVMPTQNEALRAALLNSGVAAASVLVPGGKHSYSLYETDSAQGGSTANPIDVRAHTLGFFDQYLQPRAPVITSSNLISAIRSGPVSYQVTANHAPTLFSASGLPTGWSINATNGVLTGTMPSSGTRTVTVYATGAAGTAVQTLTFTATEGITVSNTLAGTTPTLLGYNLAHFTDNGNGFDWFRYSGVKGARVFMNADELQSQTSPGRSKVTSETTFWSTISNARNAGTSTNGYIRWSDFNYDYTSTTGANDITFKYAFTQLRNLGVEVLVNITASPGTFPITSSSDWAGKWELWQHFYAQSYLLARDYDIHRFSMFNEPNNWSGLTEADWIERLRICSDAVQRAIADVNAATGKSLAPVVYAPNTASGKEKYNTAVDTWGRDSILKRYLQLTGTTSPTWSPKSTSIPWRLSHVYNYQKYSMLTHDDGSLTGYVNDITDLRSYIDADNGSEAIPPIALTEFNVRTGASYDEKTENLDTPSDYAALGANCIALTANGATELFLFKFGQTASGGVNYEVAKNGTHYVDNGSGANNYGGATKAAEVYRLFHRAAQGGRDRLAFSASTGAASSETAGLWTLVTRDSAKGLLHFFLANKNSGSVSLSLNVSALNVPEGAPVMVEEVGASSGGEGRFAGNVSSGSVALGSIPGLSTWLVTLPETASGLLSFAATDDAQLADGVNRSLNQGFIPSMTARADGTANGRKAVLIKIPIRASDASAGKSFFLDLEVASPTGATAQAHVYGVNQDAWNEGDVTWASCSFLRQNVGTGSQIPYNVVLNTGSNPVCRMLGQIVATSSTPSRAAVEVTDFVKSQTDGFATFLVVQDHRWNYSAQPVATRTSGDIQSAGLTVGGHEKAGGGARLLGFSSGGLTVAPAVLASPSSQYLNVGESATLSVTADQSLPVTFQWRKDGEIIAGANSSTLALGNVTSADAGIYTVDVTNANGTTTSEAGVVAINAAPVLVTPLADVSVGVGDPVVLSAEFSGSPPPTYVWRKNGTVISGATEASYSFIAASDSAGTYSVTAQNASGSVVSTAEVGVTAFPEGSINLSSLAAGIGEDFNALGRSRTYELSKSVYYGWTNGDGWINSGGFTNIPGWYAATDDNRNPFEGYRTINDSNGDVDPVPTRAKSGLASLGSSSGSAERALGGVAWTNNRVYFGVRIRNGTASAIQGCTVIHTMEQYSSASTNRNGTKLSLATAVNAASLRSPGWSEVISQTNLVSRSTSNSYSGIDGNSAGNFKRYTNTVSNLSVGPGDSLWLRWEISTTNAYPLAMAIDDVVVTNFVAASGPAISAHPTSLTNVSGETAVFAVTAAGQPAPSYQWLRNGSEIVGATASSLVISPARAADAGSYSVRVSNVAGVNTSTVASLAILPRPSGVVRPPVATAIDRGQSLAFASLSGGEGSVPGTFVFATPGFTPPVGTNNQTVIFNPSDTVNYSSVSTVIPVVVNRSMQTITFGLDTTTAIVGDANRTLVATSSSGLPVTFVSSNTNVASVVGNTLYIVGPGTALISAQQAGDENYLPAFDVSQTLTVATLGTTFASEFGGVGANSDGDGDGIPALQEYAFGGATNRIDRDRLPVAAFSNNELSLTYLARTNDTNLSILPERCTDLGAVNGWTNTGINVTNLGATNIGGTDYARRKATLSTSNNVRQFLRIKVSNGP